MVAKAFGFHPFFSNLDEIRLKVKVASPQSFLPLSPVSPLEPLLLMSHPNSSDMYLVIPHSVVAQRQERDSGTQIGWIGIRSSCDLLTRHESKKRFVACISDKGVCRDSEFYNKHLKMRLVFGVIVSRFALLQVIVYILIIHKQA